MPDCRSVYWLEAVHEAAHAVIATVRGLQVAFVSILPDEIEPGTSGGCLIDGGTADAVTCLAGPFAWARATIENPELVDDEDVDWDYEDVDWEMGAVLASGMSDFPMARERVGREGMAAAEEEARRSVEEHWGAIERVAMVLAMFKAIDGDRVREAIEAEAICLLCCYPIAAGQSGDMHDECREGIEEAKRGGSSTIRVGRSRP
jgi:hypothetical protein